jgi:acetyl esterase/lipase
VDTLRKTIGEQVAHMVAAGLFKAPDLTGVSKREIQIPVRDGTLIRALHYRPDSAKNSPLLVYYHGGGWVFGPPEAWEQGFATLTKELNFVVVSVDYRVAPEHVFPTAAHDSWDALQWVTKPANRYQQRI